MLKMIKKHWSNATATAAPTAQQAQAKKPVRRLVHFDAYGNALPNVPAVRDGKVKASSRKRVIVAQKTPTKKPRTKMVKAKARKAATVVASPSEIPTENVPAKIKHAVQELHSHFDQREKELLVQVDKAFHAHQKTSQKRSRRQGWLLASVASVGALAFGYLLYLMTSMQTSMVAMSGNMDAMNHHMGAMATDTQTMSQGIQTMNGSMAHLNNNVVYMNNNVAHMNHQMGAMTQAVAPMGEAAQTVSPFMKAFRSFMPF